MSQGRIAEHAEHHLRTMGSTRVTGSAAGGQHSGYSRVCSWGWKNTRASLREFCLSIKLMVPTTSSGENVCDLQDTHKSLLLEGCGNEAIPTPSTDS